MSALKIVTLTQPQKIRLKNCEDCGGISAAYQNGKDVYKTELDPVTIILGIRVSEQQQLHRATSNYLYYEVSTVSGG